MQEDKSYRHELKYTVSYADYLAIRQRLKAVMQADPHVESNGRYLIQSVYFDNSDDKALKEKIDGIGRREKFRIRYYNGDLSFVTLEKKIKNSDLCLKVSEQIPEYEFRRILNGDISFMRDHGSDLVKELYAKMQYQRLKPRVMVSYEREPYIYKAGNVRVTFDSKIRTGLYDHDFLEGKMSSVSAMDSPQDIILEVKYDAFLPEVIQDIIQVPHLRQQAFSKYGACRRFG